MSSKIDWSNAPEGATHYGPETEERYAALYKELGGRWVADGSHGWYREDGLPSSAIARPAEWDGTGLPPVGTVCEGNEYGEWVRLEVIAHYEGRAVCMLPCKERVALADPGMLRSIRTPEQSTAEKREREIDDIERVIKAAHYGLVRTDISPAERAKHYAATLHNAGYRKTEQEHGQ